MSEREILYKILFDLKKDVNDLKKLVYEGGVHDHDDQPYQHSNLPMIPDKDMRSARVEKVENMVDTDFSSDDDIDESSVVLEENLSLAETEKNLIKKALNKHSGKRKKAAEELGISERTLYRKIKEYDLV